MFARLLLLLFVLRQAKGDLVYKCNNAENEQDSIKFVPASDGVLGRYTAELCTLRNPNATEWEINLWYYRGMADCNELLKNQATHLYSHSMRCENLKRIRDISCSNMCISMDLDLIFSGCYTINSVLFEKYTTLQRISNKVTINNNLSLAQIENSHKQVEYSQNDTYVTLRWIMGVPIAQPFTMKLWRDEPSDPNDEYVALRWITGVPIAKPFTINLNTQHYKLLSENCTLSESAYEILCEFVVSEGCYRAVLEHNPWWGSAVMLKTHYLHFEYSFCKSG